MPKLMSYQWNTRRSLALCNKVAAMQQLMEPAMEMAKTDIHMGVLPMSALTHQFGIGSHCDVLFFIDRDDVIVSMKTGIGQVVDG